MWYVIRNIQDYGAIFLGEGVDQDHYERIPEVQQKLQEYGIVFVGYWEVPKGVYPSSWMTIETQITTDTSIVLSDIQNQLEWYVEESERIWHSACAAAIREIEMLKRTKHQDIQDADTQDTDAEVMDMDTDTETETYPAAKRQKV
jgi:hypothetical protein